MPRQNPGKCQEARKATLTDPQALYNSQQGLPSYWNPSEPQCGEEAHSNPLGNIFRWLLPLPTAPDHPSLSHATTPDVWWVRQDENHETDWLLQRKAALFSQATQYYLGQ